MLLDVDEGVIDGVPLACFIDNRMVRIHFIIVMIRWTGLAPLPLSRQPYIYLHTGLLLDVDEGVIDGVPLACPNP